MQNLLSSGLLSESLSRTLREERRRRMFEGRVLRVLRRIFQLKGVEVTGEWRMPHNEELND